MVALAAFLLWSCTALAQGESPRIVHVPVVSVRQGAPLVVQVEPSDFSEMGQVELYYRAGSQGDWRSLAFARTEAGPYEARVPSGELHLDGMEYYIAARGGDRPGDRFASAADPQLVHVVPAKAATSQDRELERLDHMRSRARASFDYLDFEGSQNTDWSWEARFDFTYYTLGTIRSMRFGFARLRGNGPLPSGGTLPYEETGLDQGFAEIELGIVESFGVRLCLMLGAQEQFTGGGRVTARIGHEPGTHVLLHVGGIGGVGLDTGMTLAWDTVGRLPMAAGAEVTSWPNAMDWGVKLHYELGLPIGKHADLALRASYQARNFAEGGPGAGASFSWSF